MSTNLTTTTSPPVQQISDADKPLRYLREIVAAFISLLFIGGFASMIYWTYGYIEPEKDPVFFQRAKDLLLIVNPFIGIVIGYYFNKVSTEARAENAEATARTAATATKTAEADKETALKNSETVTLALANLTAATDSMIESTEPDKSLGIDGGEQENGVMSRLRLANSRAKEVLNLRIRKTGNSEG